MSKTYRSHSPEETKTIAMQFSKTLRSGDIVRMIGELGSGKTTFIQGVAKGLHIADVVNSPTYKLINEFRGTMNLYHIDFYRLNNQEEAMRLGLDYYFDSDGVVMIEWADKYSKIIPENSIRILIKKITEEERVIEINYSDKNEHPRH